MQTECSADLFGFAPVERRAVVAGFDGGRMTSDAGALLLGATDRAIGLIERFAACFTDGRAPELVEHEVSTMVGQRIFGIALGYEDLIDHDQLRHDPTLAVLAGKLAARPQDCAPLAGKSTLNRLELGGPTMTRYHRIAWDAAKIEAWFIDLFLEAHPQPPQQIILTSTPPTTRCTGIRKGASFTAITIATAICRCTSSAVRISWRPNSDAPTLTPRSVRSRKWHALSRRSAPAGLGCALFCAPIRALPVRR
jgi:hypothetical protein